MLSCADAMREVSSEYESLPLKTRSNKTVKLRHLFMLPDEGMKSARVILSSFGDKDAEESFEMIGKMRDLLLLLADKPDELSGEMTDWPAGMFMKVVAAWQEATEMGEASDSQS